MTTINRLSAVDTLQSGDQLPVFDQSNGDARRASLSAFLNFIKSNFADPNFKTVIVEPTISGFNVDLTGNKSAIWLILNPTADFAAGSITLPPIADCYDGQEIIVTCTRSITTLTINGNGSSVEGEPTTISGYSGFKFRFNDQKDTWYTLDKQFMTNANLITFIQAGTDPVTRTSQEKMRERLTIDDFNVDPNGIIDSTAGIENADAIATTRPYEINTGTYLFNGENLPNIGNADISDFATIKNSIYSGIVQKDVGIAWLQHNHLEEEYISTTQQAITSGDIPPAPLFNGDKQTAMNVLAFWYQDFGLEATRAAAGAIGSLTWYYWAWSFHGSGGTGYEADRHPWLGWYRGDNPNVLDWQCYWLSEAGVTGVILQTRGDGAQYGAIRSTWATPSDVNHWMYQMFNNSPNFNTLTYALWAYSGSFAYDATSRAYVEGSFDEIVAIYDEYRNFNHITKNGKTYPVVYAFETSAWRGNFDNYVGSANTIQMLKDQAAKFQAKGWGGFCVIGRNNAVDLVGNQDLEANGVIVYDAEYATVGNYDPALNGGVDPAVTYGDLARGMGIKNASSTLENRYSVPGVMTSAYSHSKHPSTWNWTGQTPELFELMCRNVIARALGGGCPRIMTIYNVSEWAEGGPGLQPNMKDGKGYLNALRNALSALPGSTASPSFRNAFNKQAVEFLSAPSVQITPAEDAEVIPLTTSYTWPTSTAAPVIGDANSYDGRRIFLTVDSTSTGSRIDFEDESVRPGSGLILQQPIVSLVRDSSDYIELVYDATQSLWIQVGGSYNQKDFPFIDGFFDATDKLQVNANRSNFRITTTFSFKSTSTPFINGSGVYDGRTIVVGLDDSSTGTWLSLQDDALLAGTKLKLKTPIVTLRKGDTITLQYNEAMDKWIQIADGIVSGHKQIKEHVPGAADSVQLEPNVETCTISVTWSFTSTATPFINPVGGASYDGRRVRIMVDNASTHPGPITIQDQATLPGSGLRLTAATLTLGKNDSIDLEYDATQAVWVQVGSLINVL